MSTGRMSQLSVLIVDDHPHMVNIVRAIMRGFGVREFHDCRNSDAALEILQATPIDIVITDFAIRSLNGLELIKWIRTAGDSPNPYLPVIMLTAYAERSMVQRARDSGATEFCAKPVTPQDLYRKVCSVVNQPRTFARTEGYFGPDRRRKRLENPEDKNRRDDGGMAIVPPAAAPRNSKQIALETAATLLTGNLAPRDGVAPPRRNATQS
jgi:two-component system chemotaxis response regulator CheY